MNKLEVKMAEILKDLKNKNKYIAIKADFEAEGTRVFELINLCNMVFKENIDLVVKIGGCEAVLDLELANSFGADAVVAPMIESSFALKKFKGAKDRIYGKEEKDTVFVANIETKTAILNIDEILKQGRDFLSGVVVGRVDLCFSLDLNRDYIDSKDILQRCEVVAKKAKDCGLFVGIGGGFKFSSFYFLQKIAPFVDRFETRKFIFNFEENYEHFKYNILKATEFELLYLENKARYYKKLGCEDEKRIEILKKRINS